MLKRLLEETPARRGHCQSHAQARAPRRRQRLCRARQPRCARRGGIPLGHPPQRWQVGEGHAPRRLRRRRQRPRLHAGRQLRPVSAERSGAGRGRACTPCACRRISRRRQDHPRCADRGLCAGPAPDALFGLIRLLVGGERRRKAKALAAGEDPDGDAATLDVLAALGEICAGACRSRGVPGVPGAATAAPLLHLILAAGDSPARCTSRSIPCATRSPAADASVSPRHFLPIGCSAGAPSRPTSRKRTALPCRTMVRRPSSWSARAPAWPRSAHFSCTARQPVPRAVRGCSSATSVRRKTFSIATSLRRCWPTER